MAPTKIKKHGKKVRFLMGDTLELFANVGMSAQRRIDTNPQPGPSGILQSCGPRRALVSNETTEEMQPQSHKTRPQGRKNKENISPRVQEAPATTEPLKLGLNKEQSEAFKTVQRRRYCSWWKNQGRVLPVWAQMLTLDQLAEISNLETIVREHIHDREPTKKDFLNYYREVKSCKSTSDEVLTLPPLNRLRVKNNWRLFFVDWRTMKKEYAKGNEEVEAYFFRPIDEEQELPDPEIAAPLPVESIVETQVQTAAEDAEKEKVWQPPVEEIDLERFRRDSNIVELLQHSGIRGSRLEGVILSNFKHLKEGGTTAILQHLRWVREEQIDTIEGTQEVIELSSESEESVLEALQANDPIPRFPSPPKPAPFVSLTPPRPFTPPKSSQPPTRRSPTLPKRYVPPPPQMKRIEQLIANLIWTFPETKSSPQKRPPSRLPAWMMQSNRVVATRRKEASKIYVTKVCGTQTTVTYADHEKSPPKKKVKTQQTRVQAKETRPVKADRPNSVQEKPKKSQNALPESLLEELQAKDPIPLLPSPPKPAPASVVSSTPPKSSLPPSRYSPTPPKRPPKKKVKIQQTLLTRFFNQTARSNPRRDQKDDSEVEAKKTYPVNADRPDLVKETLEGSQNVTPDEPTKNQSHQAEKPSTTTTAPPPQQQPMETDEVESTVTVLHSSQGQVAIALTLADPPNTHESSESGNSSHITIPETPPSDEETPIQIKVEPGQQHSPYNDSVEFVEVSSPALIEILDETMSDSQELFANMGAAQPQNSALSKADRRFLQQSLETPPEIGGASQALQQTSTDASLEIGDEVQSSSRHQFIETYVKDAEASANAEQVFKRRPRNLKKDLKLI